jgi:hypothetical protein
MRDEPCSYHFALPRCFQKKKATTRTIVMDRGKVLPPTVIQRLDIGLSPPSVLMLIRFLVGLSSVLVLVGLPLGLLVLLTALLISFCYLLVNDSCRCLSDRVRSAC